jgi:uncharacterized protein (DUF2336 family)
MAGPDSPAELLLGLARSRSATDREKLIQTLARFCDTPEAGATDHARKLISDVFMVLVDHAEHEIRVRLAETVAAARWAPSALINALALDDIEIARSIIAKSPVLDDGDLMKLLVIATIDHQIEVARRPDITSVVVQAILDRGEPAVLTALAGNASAQVDPDGLARLVAAARNVASLRTPLARHPRLTAELAYALYNWVGEALREELAERFTIDPAQLEHAMNDAVGQAYSGAPSPPPPGGEIERREMETRLIAKLQAAGQLRPGFLLKSLRDGKLYLFQLALATLANLEMADVHAACNSDRPELAALACAGVGIDRSVFPTILSLLRSLNDGKPNATADTLRHINAAFTHKTPDEALNAFSGRPARPRLSDGGTRRKPSSGLRRLRAPRSAGGARASRTRIRPCR